jgi:hypothetical protein
MARDQDSRQKLIAFLDRKIFDPILRASPDPYSREADKQRLQHVQRNTESEKQRFHDDYPTAKDVRDNYLSDLSSRTAQRVDHDLELLQLPKLPDVRDEFLELCRSLGVAT